VFLGISISILCCFLVAAFSDKTKVRQIAPSDAAFKISEYVKQGLYEDAIQAGQDWLQKHPEDDFIHQQLAVVSSFVRKRTTATSVSSG